MKKRLFSQMFVRQVAERIGTDTLRPSQSATPTALPEGEPSAPKGGSAEDNASRRASCRSTFTRTSTVRRRRHPTGASSTVLALPMGEPRTPKSGSAEDNASRRASCRSTFTRTSTVRRHWQSTGASSTVLALPMGELSPKVTERVLQALLNTTINHLRAHAAKASIDLSVGKCNPSAVKIAEHLESNVFPKAHRAESHPIQ